MEEKSDGVQDAHPGTESAVSAELSRMRSRNKLLKAATIVLSGLFIVIFCAALFIYKKVSDFKNVMMPAGETFEDSAFRAEDNGLPEIPRRAMPDVLRAMASSTQVPGGSSLTVFTNAGEYASMGGRIGSEGGERAAKIAAKYADRPIVRDFMSELKKDPDFAKVLQAKAANNPLEMISSVQNLKSMRPLTLKFMMRRDFIPFMTEVMNDPDMKPMLSKLPVGDMGGMLKALKMMQSYGQSGALPPQDAGGLETYQAPEAAPGEQIGPYPSGTGTKRPVKATRKIAPPPPVD